MEVNAEEQRASVVGVLPTNDSNNESNNDQDEPLLRLPIKAEALDYCQEVNIHFPAITKKSDIFRKRS